MRHRRLKGKKPFDNYQEVKVKGASLSHEGSALSQCYDWLW